MRTIGAIDKNRTMLEQLDDYEVNGYRYSDLKPEDKAIIQGMAYAIDCIVSKVPDPQASTETIRKIEEEFKEEAYAECITDLLSDLGMTMFHMLDGYEEG